MNWSITDTILTVLFFTAALIGIILFLYKILWLKTTRSKGAIKDDEEVSMLVDEIIKKKRGGVPTSNKGTAGRNEVAAQKDALYNYFNRKTDPNIEENNSKPSGIFSFLRFRTKGYTQFSSNGSEVNDNYTVLIPPDEKVDTPTQSFSSQPTLRSITTSTSTSTNKINNPITLTTNVNTINSSTNVSIIPNNTADGVDSTSNEFLDFIQQPTTKVHSSNLSNQSISTRTSNLSDDRQNNHSSDIEDGVKLTKIK